MKIYLTCFVFLLLVAWIQTSTIEAAPKQTLMPWPLTFNSLGPIRIGMTVPQASQALGTKLKLVDYHKPNPYCYYVIPQDKRLDGVRLMVTHYKISRIDIENTRFSTASGAKIGMSEKQIKARYKPSLVEPHHYDEKGHYLIYQSNDPLYKQYALLFESDGQRVTTFRTGYREEVGYVEGCS